MKILHTSDWHLGQKLFNQDRHAEHQRALDWLLTTIADHQVDLLLVAGDIFDITNPPNQARELYYDFLRRLRDTGCRHVVITGGNHDSPSMLNAPRALLQMLDIHVVGSASGTLPAEELIELRDEKGQIEVIVAAVPFLRDRDLRYHQRGTSFEERQEELQRGIQQHYQQLADHIAERAYPPVPCLAMGHLYASGATAAAKQDNIYIGNRENIRAEQFPEVFQYVALGHIHRPQQVGTERRVRYSGSLIPLDLSETVDDKSVAILHFDQNQLQEIELLPVPTFRRLKTIQGPIDKVETSLKRFLSKEREPLTPWVELVVETDRPLPGLQTQVQEWIGSVEVHLLALRIIRTDNPSIQALEAIPDLEALDVETVFRQRCEGAGNLPDDEWQPLLQTFRELREWMNEQQEDQLDTGRG